ncbi:putative 2-ketogluconate reductase [Saccoglossus kowalevskii]|uniref:Glyoxylate reductase/hydroxypyruvate reductase-like n=1 Tax=Saccoglossus kowalevskii TaxID=10224 RepID=A0ABM0H1Q0_SACKO|nr:PREDICTED: glyoxylate reductase/hydroxypyruvate reductase-like [Saccoglossus kowalevskii]
MTSEEAKPFVLASSPGPPRGLVPEHVHMLEELFTVVWWDDFEANRDKFSNKIQGIFSQCGKPAVTEDLVAALPNLKVVSNFGVGVNHLDVAMINRHGIKVGNTPHVLSDAVADVGMMLILASARRLIEGVNIARESKVYSMFMMGNDINEATLGVIGMGNIGYKVAERARAFNMNIIYYNRERRSVTDEEKVGAKYCMSLEVLLRQSDYVMVVVPLCKETCAMIGEREFQLMKPTAVIINIARGQVIDQDAMVDALQKKLIHGAALDVTYPEPLPPDHPLLHNPNVIVTPHFGSQTVETRRKMAQMVIDNLVAGIEGKPLPSEFKA